MLTDVNKGKLASAKGFANENRFLAALLERGYNASRVDLPHSTYDIVVELDTSNMIRVQVKTVSGAGSISFTGGTRGGVDRTYQSGVKTYTQDTKTADIVVGVRSTRSNGDTSIDFYFVPTLIVEAIGQKSISINRVPKAKNAWNILENCKDKDFVYKVFKQFK